MTYLVIKTIHVIAIICWMAGLLYLPRLFVYHTNKISGSEIDVLFIKMEYRLLNYITTPAMIISAITGLLLIHYIGIAGINYWFYPKALGVIGLLICHFLCYKYQKNFALGQNKHSEKYFRFFNEIPTIMMIIIVLFVIIRPI